MKNDNQFVVGVADNNSPQVPPVNTAVANLMDEELNASNNQSVTATVTPVVTDPMMDNSSNNEYTYDDDTNNSKKKWIIIILLLLFLTAIGSFFGYKWYQDKKYDDWLQKIKDAAKKYVDEDGWLKDEILQTPEGENYKIYLKDLIGNNYLGDGDLVNPKTKKKISACNFVELLVINNETIQYVNVTINNETCPDKEGEGGKPFIQLIGEAEVVVKQNTSFQDPGAKAYDAKGNDISDRIQVDNQVNVKLSGIYSVTYNVTDENDKAADPVVRTVTVQAATTGGGGTKPPSTGGGGTKPPATDGTNPTISSTNLPGNIVEGDTLNYTLNFADNAGLKTVTYCTPTCVTRNVSGKSVSQPESFVGNTPGTYAITASTTDLSGNRANFTSSIVVRAREVDKTAPTFAWTNQVATVTQGQTLTVNVRFDDNVAVRSYRIGTSMIAGNAGSMSKTLAVPAKWVSDDYSLTVTAAPGTYTVYAQATDSSGNGTPILSIGTIRVVSGTVVASRPTLTLVSATPSTYSLASPNKTIQLVVRYQDPQGMAAYNVCVGASGRTNCANGTFQGSPQDVTLTHNVDVSQLTGNTDNFWNITAQANDITGLDSGRFVNQSIGKITLTP